MTREERALNDLLHAAEDVTAELGKLIDTATMQAEAATDEEAAERFEEIAGYLRCAKRELLGVISSEWPEDQQEAGAVGE